MEWDKFSGYLQQVLALATAVFEGPTFGYTETALGQCFQKVCSFIIDENIIIQMYFIKHLK